jgi:TPR repeat protein
LAVIYDEGVDVSENNELAVEWYQKSAIQGHGVAQLNLGILYLNGEGVKQNNELAWNLLNNARMNRMNNKAQWRARSLLSEMKQKLRIKAGENSYPAWNELRYY